MIPKLLALIERTLIDDNIEMRDLTIYLYDKSGRILNARELLSLANISDMSIFQLASLISGKNNKLLKTNFYKLLLIKFMTRAGTGDQKISNDVVNRALNCFNSSLNGTTLNTISAQFFESKFLKPFSREFNTLIPLISADSFKYYPAFNQQTYHNRYPHHEEILRNNVIPKLIAKNKKIRNITILSLGCSLGYGILDTYNILQELLPGSEKWQITLIGYDISTETLDTARENTFANLPDNVKLELNPAVLGDPLYMEAICSREYDIALVRKTAMYLQRPVMDHYRNNLQAQFILSTDDFIPGKRYDILREAEHDYEQPIFINIGEDS